MKKAIIFDLDNTIYSIGETLFAPLFELLEQYGTQLLAML